MTQGQSDEVQGDRPIECAAQDRLGFQEVAARLVTALTDQNSSGGLVIGLEGRWGSGKSSLLGLIQQEIAALPADRRPSVINFRPWLVGNRDALLATMFAAMQKEINQVVLEAGDATGISKQKAEEAAEAMRKFVVGLGKAGAAVEVIGDAVGFAAVKWVGSTMKALREGFKDKAQGQPLEVLKEKIVTSLEELGHRFLITIDDVDRLEPNEIIEVLRLTRSVADFPNVTYLLCYDAAILAHSIEQASRVEDGHAYLEKIIQLAVPVPTPEPFQLRQWFADNLRDIAYTTSDSEVDRLKSVIDIEGGRHLKTPRAVIRTLDAIRFAWPTLRDVKGDLPDLVWINLIKNGNAALYRWIEDYCGSAAVINLGTGMVGEGEQKKKLEELATVTAKDYFSDSLYRHYFAEPLPGVEANLGEDGPGFKLFLRVDRMTGDIALQEGRLASPDHYRFYFALSSPSHALSQGDLQSFMEAVEQGPPHVASVILRLHAMPASGSLSKADILFERIKVAVLDTMSAPGRRNLLIALSDCLDEAYRLNPFSLSWSKSLWDRALDLIPLLLRSVHKHACEAVLHDMFAGGRAIGWLTSIMRAETFSHGRFGQRKRLEQEWLLSEEQLDIAFELMLARFRAMSPQDILGAISPIDILFAWSQAGDEDGPRKLAAAVGQDDTGLVEFLEAIALVRHGAKQGSYTALTARNIDTFVDFEETRKRIAAIATSVSALSERAQRLSRAFDEGDRL